MFFKKKGQGALEYLLLIGGAVLIAVIVIALLVGMGGQSRETAQDQATKAQQALEQPQPATIVSLRNDPATTCGTNATLLLDWQQLGEGGTYKFTLLDYSGEAMHITDAEPSAAIATSPTVLTITDPQEKISVFMDSKACADTYWGEIETTKNGQTVKSTRMKINME